MGENNGGDRLRMNLRFLRVPAFLILALSISSYAQSLGEVARQLRAERQQSGPSNLRVITNEDVESPASLARQNAAEDETKDTAQKEPGKQGEETPNAASSAGEADNAKVRKDPVKEREERELALDKRSEEINRTYLDRIAAIRTQISTAQQELAKLQFDQVQSTTDFQRTLGVSPNVATYQEQQRSFNEQIEAHRNLITNLNSQLQDAQEAARHAGVPHATD